MSKHKNSIRDLLPHPDSEPPGDMVPPIDLWMEGEIDLSDLPPEDQRSARLMFDSDDTEVQMVSDKDESIRFMPGDRFGGLPKEKILERLVLSPSFGPIDPGAASQSRVLLVVINDEEVDVMRERGEMPLAPCVAIKDRPIVEIRLGQKQPSLAPWATLFESSPWLLSVRQGHPDLFLPIPSNEMGEESEYRRTYEAWRWVLEMTEFWAVHQIAGDLDITSQLLEQEEDPDEMEDFLSLAAEGGLGVVYLNNRVAYAVEGNPGECAH